MKEYMLISVRCSDSKRVEHKPNADLPTVERQKVFWAERSSTDWEHYIVWREVNEWFPLDEAAAAPVAGLRLVTP